MPLFAAFLKLLQRLRVRAKPAGGLVGQGGFGHYLSVHPGKTSGTQITSRSFFAKTTFRSEQEQRSDLGKWETVLHASDNFRGSSLNQATFALHYNVRDGGGAAGSGSELIRYALVVTVEEPKHLDLHEAILAAHSRLKAIEPRISLPLRMLRIGRPAG